MHVCISNTVNWGPTACRQGKPWAWIRLLGSICGKKRGNRPEHLQCSTKEAERWRRTREELRGQVLEKSRPRVSTGCPQTLQERLGTQQEGLGTQQEGHIGKDLGARKIEGKRRRGQQRMKWLDGIIDSMDLSLSKLGRRGW